MEYNKKADPNSKPIKYLKNRIDGKNKSQSALDAGYKDPNHTPRIEETKTYKKGIEELLMDREEVFKEHKKNIKQDQDKGAKNKAMDMFYKLNKEYPKDTDTLEEGDVKVIVKKG